MKHRIAKLLGVTALIGASTLAQATLSVYTSRASFLAAVGDVQTDTFNDLVPGQGYDGPMSRNAGGIGYEVTSDDDRLYGAGNRIGFGWLSNYRAADTISFSGFDPGVFAAGARFFGSDISGAYQSGATLYITATDADGSLSHTLVNARRVSFVGFVSDGSLLSLTVSADQGGGAVWGTVNNLMLAAVPEPGTYALMLAGLGLVGAAVRRRR